MNAMLVEQRLDTRQSQVVAAKGRSFVPGDEGRGVESRAPIPAHLIHGKPHQRLNAGQVGMTAFNSELVVEFHWWPA